MFGLPFLKANHSHTCPLCERAVAFSGKCSFTEKTCPAILRHVDCGCKASQASLNHKQQTKPVGPEVKGWCNLHVSFQPCRWCEFAAERESKSEDDSPLEPKEV